VSVISNNGELTFTRVLCVVLINFGRTEKLIEFSLNGLKITKKHPIWFNNQWQMPVDIAAKDTNIANICDSTSNCVYNFLLEHSHVLLVNNVPCVTFGHGIKEAYHPFYSTQVVVDVIKGLPGFEKGFVKVNGSLRQVQKKMIKIEPERENCSRENMFII